LLPLWHVRCVLPPDRAGLVCARVDHRRARHDPPVLRFLNIIARICSFFVGVAARRFR
jgi:hypothetical protein